MDFNKNKISEIIKNKVENLGYLLIDIVFKGDARNRIIEIFIDSEKGITTSDCVDVTRVCSDILDEMNLIESQYRLDVSSPGIDRPLKYIEQFKRNTGRFFELEFEDQAAEKFEGKLLAVDGNELKFNIDKKEEKINLNNIKSAKVLVRF
jgi:ribosome maturation factor RimP